MARTLLSNASPRTCIFGFSLNDWFHTGTHPAGMEVDAFMVSNARLDVLLGMNDIFYFATSLPSGKLAETPYEVVLCTGGDWILTCNVPEGMSVKDFVHEVCARATHR